MKEFKGNWATMLLPINEDESINYGLLEKELDRMIEAGVDGIYSNGTAGEFFTLSPQEYEATAEILAGKCADSGMPFQIGASYFSAQVMLERIRAARRYRPDAIQVVLPEWFPVTNREAIAFLQKAADTAEGIPLVLYNPPHAKRNLQTDDWLEILSAVPEIRSIKICDGDQAWYESMQPVFRMTDVFVPGHHLATGVAHGAKGAYSNVAALSPSKAQKWYDLMCADLDQALREEQALRSFFAAYIDPLIIRDRHANFAVDKYLCVMGGWCEMPVRIRFPYAGIPLDQLDFHRKAMRTMIPFFVDDSLNEQK